MKLWEAVKKVPPLLGRPLAEKLFFAASLKSRIEKKENVKGLKNYKM